MKDFKGTIVAMALLADYENLDFREHSTYLSILKASCYFVRKSRSKFAG